jgi:3-oxoacyl-(acyl-carrier-protein) synthase
MDFANSVINAAAGQAAIWHDLRGVNTTVSCGEASGLAAIAYAVEALRRGLAGALLTGGVEELCFESYLGHLRAGRLYRGGDPPVPFDARRSGFALAEGAGVVMLESEDAARQRNGPVLGWVLGHGAAFSPARDAERLASRLARAIELALGDAGLAADDVDCVSAGASGSVVGDHAEALALARVFGARAASLPVSAVKAQLGEALGASGGFQAVALLGTLAGHGLSGVPGLRTEEGFPLGGIAAASRSLAARRALATAISADGHCHAVIFGAD